MENDCLMGIGFCGGRWGAGLEEWVMEHDLELDSDDGCTTL